MDSNFFVSYEAAKLLKEKGYNDEYINFYNEKGELIIPYDKEEYRILYPCPTKAEAIDWLDSKGIRINIIYDWIECKWYFTIIKGSPTIKNITELEVSDSVFYKTRLEAEDSAIIKAQELLKKGE